MQIGAQRSQTWTRSRWSRRARALIVQKYGGTSVGDLERIQHVASRVVETQKAGHQVVVCVSAMSGETNALVSLAEAISAGEPDARECDVLLSTGEQKTIALLSMAIKRLGHSAQSFNGRQLGLPTDAAHGRARTTAEP